MTFPIVIAVIGALLLAIGLLGKLQIRELVGETTSTPIRVVLCLVGSGLMLLAFYIYKSDQPGPADASNITARVNPKSVEKGPAVAITSFVSGQSVEVQLIKGGGGAFTVSGTSAGVEEDASLRIFLLIHPENPYAEGWWIQSPSIMESDGNWSARALVGNAEFLPKLGDTVTILAIAAPRDAPAQTKTDDPKDLKPVAQSKIVRLKIDPVRRVSSNRIFREGDLAPTSPSRTRFSCVSFAEELSL